MRIQLTRGLIKMMLILFLTIFHKVLPKVTVAPGRNLQLIALT